MGLFSRLFASKSKVSNIDYQKKKMNELIANQMGENKGVDLFEDEINSIIEILNNLGLLSENDIEAAIEKVHSDYDYSILKRLMIKTSDTNIEYLKKYFRNTKLGFGTVMTEKYKKKLYEKEKDLLDEGRSEADTLEELIEYAKVEIESYEKILIDFNETIKTLEENSPTEADKIALIDYWTNYFKEQRLGYPIDLSEKIDSMAKDLASLPYGGFGDAELRKFKDAAYKYAEEGKILGENPNETYTRIKTSLFEPKKQRYTADVETLEKKLDMIDESPHLKAKEKEQNKQQILIEFNQMNGHSLDIDGTINQLRIKLELLEYGGYGKIIIDEFISNSQKISYQGKENGLKESEIIDAIKREYSALLGEYEQELKSMKEKLKEIDNQVIPVSEKDRRKNDIIEDFHDSMGHELDYKERINKMILDLKSLEYGGYGDLIVDAFKEKAVKIVQDAKSEFEVAKAIKEIRNIYNSLASEYKAKLDMHFERIAEIRNDDSLSLEEKEERIEELEKKYKFALGFRMNFEKIIGDFQKELKSLDKGGYGEEALEEFRAACDEILEKDLEEKEKYSRIKQKFTILKSKYISNLRIFANWKMMRLNSAKDEEKENLSKDLDSQISYMLSLSAKQLVDYYKKDDEQRKNDAEKHNKIAACRFLARKESEHYDNEEIYKSRLEEIRDGNIPYSDEKIAKALSRLERLSITSEDCLRDDERLITKVDYIDSTLLSQMMRAEKYTNE